MTKSSSKQGNPFYYKNELFQLLQNESEIENIRYDSIHPEEEKLHDPSAKFAFSYPYEKEETVIFDVRGTKKPKILAALRENSDYFIFRQDTAKISYAIPKSQWLFVNMKLHGKSSAPKITTVERIEKEEKFQNAIINKLKEYGATEIIYPPGISFALDAKKLQILLPICKENKAYLNVTNMHNRARPTVDVPKENLENFYQSLLEYEMKLHREAKSILTFKPITATHDDLKEKAELTASIKQVIKLVGEDDAQSLILIALTEPFEKEKKEVAQKRLNEKLTATLPAEKHKNQKEIIIELEKINKIYLGFNKKNRPEILAHCMQQLLPPTTEPTL